MYEDRKIGRDIHIVSNKIRRKMDNETQRFDLTPAQFHFLMFIIESDGEVFQRDIEIAFNLRRSTVSKILALLESRGIVTRENVKSDGRLKKITITKYGYEQVNAVKETFDEFDRYLKGSIDSKDLEVFYKVLDKLRQLTD